MKNVALASAMLLSLAPLATAGAATLLKETFDTDAVGKFPPGWTLRYNGLGTSLQGVDTAHAISAPNSLKLVGSSCWSANAYHPLTVPVARAGYHTHMRLTGYVYLGALAPGGCDNVNAAITFENPGIGTWGTNYGGVNFASDGYVYANYGSANVTRLGGFSLGVWYKVTIDSDLTAQTSKVYINNVLKVSNLAYGGSGLPTGVEVAAGHGSNPTAWFDSLTVTTSYVKAAAAAP